jgi:hypothetical protein
LHGGKLAYQRNKRAFRNSLLRKAFLSRGDKIRTCDLLNPIRNLGCFYLLRWGSIF